MKVLLVTDYFYPFTPGGSEWSVYELAKALKVKRIDSVIATINYGALARDNYYGLKIRRIPFLKKLENKRSVVNPIWQNNPVFFLISVYFLIKLVREEKPDILHVHGKFLIPGAVIAGFITQKPVIVTIRDKQLLCSIGKCFFDVKRFKACSFWEYITSDFIWFCNNYTNKNPLIIAYVFLGALWSRFSASIIKFFAKKASVITAISESQKKYLEANGFKNIRVVYNTASFKKPKTTTSKTKSVLFVGKLSKGKGVELLLDAAEDLLKTRKIKFIFAGKLQSPKIKSRFQEKILKSNTKLLGGVDYHSLPILYRRVSLLIMPSIYPESFGRTALEAISFGTPVVVTNTGALPEIVNDKVTGRVVDVSVANLEDAILEVLENEKVYRENIKKNYRKLKKKFMLNPINEYIKLYKRQDLLTHQHM
ncbi:hypothetical protein A2164_03760 [Candidatus Curtissbacteria bacterium RBG_13_35_7]|uniref:Glycosyl transferase family 1 domain-containing protein n=1 Tax=Candidatus Curtissbacteria bacterium RBG_13_35_7 TaxID=1797705 RepID=A0A1F5G398_9BACT|nr:MAG: hypothetical protein A2164_03760 [Candidatus Curtissbacteria bacterium RBG_13_35_7]